MSAALDALVVRDVTAWLETLAPLHLSESWDNTGLLLGDLDLPVAKIQACLTLTPASVDEAIGKHADLVVAHHPLPFKALSRITTQDLPGRLLWKLASHGISVYCPHTAWDSAALGINALLSRKLGLLGCNPIVPNRNALDSALGAGRIGTLPAPMSVEQIASHLSREIPVCRPRGVRVDCQVSCVAIACGSGGSLLSEAIQQGCELFLTGEATFHTCLQAEAEAVSLLMIGHFASERFAMEHLAAELASAFPSVQVWASDQEQDPVRNIVVA